MHATHSNIRIVTATSLFDGHDAAINIMRRILQQKGAEVIHLGHNRSVHEIVECAIEEDVQAIAVTSYQGGHVEFFKYMKDLLEENGCGHIRIFGGGGGTILPDEIDELHQYGIARIYSPDDGRHMGLEGMIEDLLSRVREGSPTPTLPNGEGVSSSGVADKWLVSKNLDAARFALGEWKDIITISKAITLAENGQDYKSLYNKLRSHDGKYFKRADPGLYKLLKEFSLSHRKNPTTAEAALWNFLSGKQLNGIKFRRQHIIDSFIADFISLQHKLIIEIDGLYHQLPETIVSDEERTNILNGLGFRVIRFSNEEILHGIENVKQKILAEITATSSQQSPKVSPIGGDLEGARGVAAPVVLGITGTGGAGKSSVTDEIVRRFLHNSDDKTIAVVSVDPSKKKTGGALLGDRIRMNSIHHARAYMRSLATRESDRALSAHVQEAIDICKAAGYDFIILESAGVGQSDASILDHCDLSLYVMTPEYGAPSQLEKINMLDYADLVAINKFDKAGALDALHDVRKQYKRNHKLFTAKDDEIPVIGTVASQFNDPGINELFQQIIDKTAVFFQESQVDREPAGQSGFTKPIIHSSRARYLGEIAERIREYDQLVKDQSGIATKLYQLHGALNIMKENPRSTGSSEELRQQIASYENQLTPVSRKLIHNWSNKIKAYQEDFYQYTVRDHLIRQEMFTESLSGTRIPKVALPKYKDWGDLLQWQAQENAPGHFPFTAGVFPLKREGEDPTRMFAGEGSPERTNRRFHYVSADQPSKRLSTAFDSVTLYGEDPGPRPDIYGKVGNSGVSIATIDDAKKLYCGFDLCDPKTSVSMTINGPAPIILAFFLNAAIDQQCEQWITANGQWSTVNEKIKHKYKHMPRPVYFNADHFAEAGTGTTTPLGLGLLGLSGDEVLPVEIYQKIKGETLTQVRGTVQADILKEDQAQNTCIFSTEFALTLMGDVQEYIISHAVRNFYSVSISGYHIAEAGANPITQLAFTLANGFTYVEYYLSRGMAIDDFAPNLSFFFSNGMDAEYSVIGRVARRIWAKAMKYKYKANKRSQMLKYHIQTSGRSLHAQEIDFNDIRTTLQALYAVYDNCNSLHTNAYDEAITTPTEDSVRRAMAIQLIINRELGSARTENFIQGSFIIEELTALVEDAVLREFDRLTDRGGVLGAMERMYQRNKIQEESLQYESLKHSGALPVVGVNTFLNKKGSPTIIPRQVIRSTTEEKDLQISNLQAFQQRNGKLAPDQLNKLKEVAVHNGNLFEALMETVKYCSLGQITHALYEVGGQYRRNM